MLDGKKVVGAALTREDYSGPEPYADIEDPDTLASAELVANYEWDGSKLVPRTQADKDKEIADREQVIADKKAALQAAWDSLGLRWTKEQAEAVRAKLDGVI